MAALYLQLGQRAHHSGNRGSAEDGPTPHHSRKARTVITADRRFRHGQRPLLTYWIDGSNWVGDEVLQGENDGQRYIDFILRPAGSASVVTLETKSVPDAATYNGKTRILDF
jgi:hypothetical protein